MDHQPGLKIIRPTAIRTNFSDGLGLPKLGLGQDRVPEKFSSQVLDFWLQKEPKVWFGLNFRLPMYVPISRILVRFGHQKNRFLPLDFGFYFWLNKTITKQCAYFISCRVGSWVILDGGLGCLDK